MTNEKLVYEKPVLTKHAQLREVTLSSLGSGNIGGNNGNDKPKGNSKGGGNGGRGNNGNGNGNGGLGR